jgi:hypothetical protein
MLCRVKGECVGDTTIQTVYSLSRVKKYIMITVLYDTNYIVLSGSMARTLKASSSPSARESSERPPPATGTAVGTAK